MLGTGIGLLVAVGIAAAGEWPDPARRPHVLAWAIAGMPAAWIAGMPVVGAVAGIDWRVAWLAVPMLVALLALVLVRLRPADQPSQRAGAAVGAWRRPAVARFTAGELLANAAWASVLTYAGALLLDQLRALARRGRARARCHGRVDASRHVHGASPCGTRDAGTADGADGVPGRAPSSSSALCVRHRR